jgi:hypothetical protein
MRDFSDADSFDIWEGPPRVNRAELIANFMPDEFPPGYAEYLAEAEVEDK